ncbi:TonB-dependent receptor [Danxiaibacter flavus]|uniref:TonB-dependent receptor n=1 Tax=Danxiaibacter flavus TaxID=3049108 RepID=A0ABV3ZP82_9BACT|nr:TonB-dependent receptor [Chitinophagaceae bacterium DXS]
MNKKYKWSPSCCTHSVIVKSFLVLIALNLALLNKAFSQDHKLSGTITDSSGKAVAGASVMIKGTQRGTASNENGFFELNAQVGQELVISAMGYADQTVKITSTSTPLEIRLTATHAVLEDVVVVGYGTQKKVNLTGAVATVSGKTLQDRPITNVGQGLQGLVPNLNISFANGAPGMGATFNIRGTTSLNGGSPLILVDGVQMDANLIDPADVESVTVLKDAASAAIYGGRAAYGVILITTKKAAGGVPKINYSGSYTIFKPTRQAKYLNSVDYIRIFNEANRTGMNGGTQASSVFTEQDSVLTTAYFNDPANNSTVYIDPGNPNKYRYVGNTDWIKELYPGWAAMQQHNLSLSGGNAKTSYAASLGYFTQGGILKLADQRYNRLNPSLKVKTEITDWFTVNASILLNHWDYNTPAPTNNGGTSSGWITGDARPLMPVKHPDGNYSGQGSFTNPIAVMEQNGRSKTTANDLWLTGRAILKPVKHVTVTADYTWNNYTNFNQQNYKEFMEYGVNGMPLGLFAWTKPNGVTESFSNDNYYALNAYADYENTFAGKHYVKATVGYNQELKQSKYRTEYAKNLIDQELPSINLNNDSKPSVGGSQSEWALSGNFFRLNYVYANKYLLEVNGRYDGSSKFARGNRYYFSPSVSAGWRISKEAFFEPFSNVVSNLKIRASYGTLANQAVASNYPYISTMTANAVNYIYGDQLGMGVSTPGLVSSNFTWEKVTSNNIGLDFGFLNEKLTGYFEWYTRATKGMVVAGSPLPAVLGTTAPRQNAADLKTRGWELNLSWKDKVGKDVSYSVGLALSDYQAEITKYDLNPNKVIGSNYTGQKMGEIWGYVTDGYFKSDEDAAAADQSKIWNGRWLAGDIKYKDLDGKSGITPGANSVTDPGDRKIIGNNTPRYQYGINASVSYKGLDLVIFVQGIAKRDVWMADNAFRAFASEWSVPMVYAKDYWTPQNNNAYFPRIRFGGGNYETQSKYLQHASYLRMKELSVGYTFPKQWTDKAKLSRLRVYVTGQNLFEFTKLFKAYDPEILDFRGYPLNRAIAFGLQLGL